MKEMLNTKSESVKLYECMQENLNQSSDFFKTEGLDIAIKIAQENGNKNTNCDIISKAVVEAALAKGINCKIVKPFVIVNGETGSNNHTTILVTDENKLVDYTIMQFLGDNKTVEYYELVNNSREIFVLDSKTMQPKVVDELNGANLDQIYSISGKHGLIVELI